MFGNDLVRFGPVRFGKKNSGSVRFGGSVKILVRSNTTKCGLNFRAKIIRFLKKIVFSCPFEECFKC